MTVAQDTAKRRGRPPGKHASTHSDARERLLRAGLGEFAGHGFEGASTRAIASRANANIALIGYHFSDKAGLYRAVLNSISAPMRVGFARLAEPELDLADALRFCYGGFLADLREPDDTVAQAIRLHFRECMDPSAVFRDWIDAAIHPMFSALLEVLRQHLQLKRIDDDLRRLAFAIIALANDYWMSGPFMERFAPKLRQPKRWVETTIERLTLYGCALVEAERARRAKGGK